MRLIFGRSNNNSDNNNDTASLPRMKLDPIDEDHPSAFYRSYIEASSSRQHETNRIQNLPALRRDHKNKNYHSSFATTQTTETNLDLFNNNKNNKFDNSFSALSNDPCFATMKNESSCAKTKNSEEEEVKLESENCGNTIFSQFVVEFRPLDNLHNNNDDDASDVEDATQATVLDFIRINPFETSSLSNFVSDFILTNRMKQQFQEVRQKNSEFSENNILFPHQVKIDAEFKNPRDPLLVGKIFRFEQKREDLRQNSLNLIGNNDNISLFDDDDDDDCYFDDHKDNILVLKTLDPPIFSSVSQNNNNNNNSFHMQQSSLLANSLKNFVRRHSESVNNCGHVERSSFPCFSFHYDQHETWNFSISSSLLHCMTNDNTSESRIETQRCENKVSLLDDDNFFSSLLLLDYSGQPRQNFGNNEIETTLSLLVPPSLFIFEKENEHIRTKHLHSSLIRHKELLHHSVREIVKDRQKLGKPKCQQLERVQKVSSSSLISSTEEADRRLKAFFCEHFDTTLSIQPLRCFPKFGHIVESKFDTKILPLIITRIGQSTTITKTQDDDDDFSNVTKLFVSSSKVTAATTTNKKFDHKNFRFEIFASLHKKFSSFSASKNNKNFASSFVDRFWKETNQILLFGSNPLLLSSLSQMLLPLQNHFSKHQKYCSSRYYNFVFGVPFANENPSSAASSSVFLFSRQGKKKMLTTTKTKRHFDESDDDDDDQEIFSSSSLCIENACDNRNSAEKELSSTTSSISNFFFVDPENISLQDLSLCCANGSGSRFFSTTNNNNKLSSSTISRIALCCSLSWSIRKQAFDFISSSFQTSLSPSSRRSYLINFSLLPSDDTNNNNDKINLLDIWRVAAFWTTCVQSEINNTFLKIPEGSSKRNNIDDDDDDDDQNNEAENFGIWLVGSDFEQCVALIGAISARQNKNPANLFHEKHQIKVLLLDELVHCSNSDNDIDGSNEVNSPRFIVLVHGAAENNYQMQQEEKEQDFRMLHSCLRAKWGEKATIVDLCFFGDHGGYGNDEIARRDDENFDHDRNNFFVDGQIMTNLDQFLICQHSLTINLTDSNNSASASNNCKISSFNNNNELGYQFQDCYHEISKNVSLQQKQFLLQKEGPLSSAAISKSRFDLVTNSILPFIFDHLEIISFPNSSCFHEIQHQQEKKKEVFILVDFPEYSRDFLQQNWILPLRQILGNHHRKFYCHDDSTKNTNNNSIGVDDRASKKSVRISVKTVQSSLEELEKHALVAQQQQAQEIIIDHDNENNNGDEANFKKNNDNIVTILISSSSDDNNKTMTKLNCLGSSFSSFLQTPTTSSFGVSSTNLFIQFCGKNNTVNGDEEEGEQEQEGKENVSHDSRGEKGNNDDDEISLESTKSSMKNDDSNSEQVASRFHKPSLLIVATPTGDQLFTQLQQQQQQRLHNNKSSSPSFPPPENSTTFFSCPSLLVGRNDIADEKDAVSLTCPICFCTSSRENDEFCTCNEDFDLVVNFDFDDEVNDNGKKFCHQNKHKNKSIQNQRQFSVGESGRRRSRNDGDDETEISSTNICDDDEESDEQDNIFNAEQNETAKILFQPQFISIFPLLVKNEINGENILEIRSTSILFLKRKKESEKDEDGIVNKLISLRRTKTVRDSNFSPQHKNIVAMIVPPSSAFNKIDDDHDNESTFVVEPKTLKTPSSLFTFCETSLLYRDSTKNNNLQEQENLTEWFSSFILKKAVIWNFKWRNILNVVVNNNDNKQILRQGNLFASLFLSIWFLLQQHEESENHTSSSLSQSEVENMLKDFFQSPPENKSSSAFPSWLIEVL